MMMMMRTGVGALLLAVGGFFLFGMQMEGVRASLTLSDATVAGAPLLEQIARLGPAAATAVGLAALVGAAWMFGLLGRGRRSEGRLAAAAALERGRGAILRGLAVIGVFFGGAFAWGALAPLESAAIMSATVKVDNNRQTLDHQDGGTIAELMVSEGDAVARDQVLIRLDTTDIAAEVEILSRQLDGLTAQAARLRAEEANAETFTFPERLTARAAEEPQVAEITTRQSRLFAIRLDRFNGEQELRRERIAQLNEQIRGLEARLASVRERKSLTEAELENRSELYAKGLARADVIMEFKLSVASLLGEQGQIIASIAEAKGQISETKLSIRQLARQRQDEASQELREVETQILQITPRLTAAQARLSRSELRAPSDGVVFGLNKFTVGGVIRPGEPVLDVVPSGSDLVIDMQIRPLDVDDIAVGMPARVQFLSFSFHETDPVDGVLIQVSPDALIDETTREAYYRGVVEVPEETLAALDIELQPGMPAQVMVPLGEKSAFEYIFDPLLQGMDVALREN